MKTLKKYILEAKEKKVAIGHFNIASLEQLKAIFEAGVEFSKNQKEKLPLIIGTSEGEGGYVGFKQAAALVKSLREEFDYPIFINGDHIHSLEKAKEIVEAGYDAVIFDVSKLPFEENLKQTKEAVKILKRINRSILIEGEIGFIGSSSKILKEIPEGAAIKPADLTKPEEAERFVKETKVDLLSPAVGSIHGMFGNVPDPDLNITRIREITAAVSTPLVLHGGSGLTDENFFKAIDVGICIVHINTEVRFAWRKALEKSLKDNPEEITPYKVILPVIEEMKKVVFNKLKVFNGIKN